MNIDLRWSGVQIQSHTGRIWLSSQEVINLMRWCVAHEGELTAFCYEQEREQQKKSESGRSSEQPQYFLERENGDK